MNQSQKLNLFVGLGCKAMKDVILDHALWQVNVGDSKMSEVEKRNYVKTALEFQNQMSIEAIPERQPPIEISTNLLNLFNDYGEIEAVKDIPPCYHREPVII